MSINSIETQDTNRYPFGTIAKGAIGGGVLGYVAKQTLPLTESEMDAEFKAAMAIVREQSNKAKASAIETIRNIKDKTPAQDTFIKMIDTEVPASKNRGMARVFSMKRIIGEAKLDNSNMLELEGLIANVNKTAGKTYKRYAKGVANAVKSKRITPIYVAAGAVAGFFAGFGKIIARPNA